MCTNLRHLIMRPSKPQISSHHHLDELQPDACGCSDHRLNFTSLQTQSRLGQGSPGGSSVESHTRTRASGYYFESFTHPRVSVVVEWLTGYGDHNQPQGQYPKCPMPSPPRFCWDPDLTDSGWVVWVLLYGFDFACVLI